MDESSDGEVPKRDPYYGTMILIECYLLRFYWDEKLEIVPRREKLTHDQWAIMQVIGKEPRSMSELLAQEVEGYTESKQYIAKVLVKRGIATWRVRIGNPEKQLELTSAGLKVLKKIEEKKDDLVAEVNQRFAESYTERERKYITGALHELQRIVKSYSRE